VTRSEDLFDLFIFIYSRHISVIQPAYDYIILLSVKYSLLYVINDNQCARKKKTAIECVTRTVLINIKK